MPRARAKAQAVRRARILRAAAALGGLALIVVLGRRLPEALAGMEAFRVDGFQLEGARFLSLDEAVRVAAVEPGASVWDDRAPWEARLAAHPLVHGVRVRRRLPSTLVFVVDEEEPVALVPTPTLEPVDHEGRYLPLDPARHGLDLPVVRPGDDRSADGKRPAEVTVRPLARAVERMREHPLFFGQVSEVSEERDGSIRVRWGGGPEIDFRFGRTVELRRIEQGLLVLSHALSRDAARAPRSVDLRFADQVVVRY
jgi:POTRA domain, FtsQ-type